jgi:hypothetical protein
VSNTQLYLSIGLPTLMILIGLVLNWTATKEIGACLGVIEADMRQFYRAIGKLEGRMDAVEK